MTELHHYSHCESSECSCVSRPTYQNTAEWYSQCKKFASLNPAFQTNLIQMGAPASRGVSRTRPTATEILNAVTDTHSITVVASVRGERQCVIHTRSESRRQDKPNAHLCRVLH